MKKGNLTLKTMKKLYEETLKYQDDYIIKWWQTPLLWVLYFFIGYSVKTESGIFYWVDFKNVRYLLKTKEL